LLVSFPSDGPDALAHLAQQFLPRIRGHVEETENTTDHDEAAWLLEYLANRKGFSNGPKGGMFTWGIIGNSTDVDRFVKVLEPFWRELLRPRWAGGTSQWPPWGGPYPEDVILVMYHRQSDPSATAIIISSATPHAQLAIAPDLRIVKHALPFTFWADR
jgi:hypothetical protein